MSNVIEFIEKLGQDARLRHATRSEVEQVLHGASISPEIRAALLAGDQHRLEALLGASTSVCCMIHAPKTDEDEAEQPRKAKEGEKEKAA